MVNKTSLLFIERLSSPHTVFEKSSSNRYKIVIYVSVWGIRKCECLLVRRRLIMWPDQISDDSPWIRFFISLWGLVDLRLHRWLPTQKFDIDIYNFFTSDRLKPRESVKHMAPCLSKNFLSSLSERVFGGQYQYKQTPNLGFRDNPDSLLLLKRIGSHFFL